MSKHASLQNQFFNVLEQNTELGRSKNSDKGTYDNINHTIIYSRADRENLANTSKDLTKYVKENFNNVRFIKDIKPEMVQNFLDTKVGNSQATIDKTWSLVGKIERLVEQVYPIDLGWKENLEKPESLIGEKIRDVSFDKSDWDKVQSFIDSKSKPSISDKGLLLARDFGLRAESVTNIRTKDISISGDTATLYIYQDKGGRDRTLTTKYPQVIDRLENLVKGKDMEDKLIPVKPDSINRELARIEDTLGIRTKYQDAKTGIHAIRKMWAKEQFINNIEAGMTKQEAMDKVSKDLGHGANRNALMAIYIGAETIDMY